MADLPSFSDLYVQLSKTFDALETVSDDYLRPSPAARRLRHPDERRAGGPTVPDPTADAVMDDRRRALSAARSEALVVLAYIANRLPQVRQKLAAAHTRWQGVYDEEQPS